MKVIVRQSALLFLFLILPAIAMAASFTGKVVKVTDGDTVHVLLAGNIQEKIRLAQIDAPETKGQAFGQKSKNYLQQMIIHETVRVDYTERDRYGRIVGEIFLPDGTNANRRMVEAGFAWRYDRYSDDLSLELLEAEARRQKKGLWADPESVPPWEWRKMQREKRSKK